MNNFKLLQLVVFACTCLLLLKSAAFVFSGGSVLTGTAELNAQEASVKAEANNKETDKAGTKARNAGQRRAEEKGVPAKQEMMGPVPEKELKTADAKSTIKNLKPDDLEGTKVPASASELDLLESLSLRRKQLNERETQLSLKENLLKAAERQIDERIKQLKEIEAKIQVDLKKQDVMHNEQYKRLVKIYSSMKPKEAARIFDGLRMPVLVDLVRAMKASAGSQILAKMKPEKARELTLLLAQKDQLVMQKQTLMNKELPSVIGDKPALKNQ